MYYRITVKDAQTTWAEELQTSQGEAQKKAFEMLEANDKKGEAIIERRHSPYSGDFNNYMTCRYASSVSNDASEEVKPE